MDAHARQRCQSPDTLPRLLDADKMLSRPVSWEHVWIARHARQVGQYPQRTWGQEKVLRARLAVRQPCYSLRLIDPLPAQCKDFAQTGPREDEETQGRDAAP